MSHVPMSKESWDVFQEDVARSYFANHPKGIRPEVTFVGVAQSLSCDTPGLTRESCGDEINVSTPALPVKGPHIVPDGEGWEEAVPLPLDEDPLAVGVDLDGTHGAVAEDESRKEASAAAGKEVQFTQGQ